MVDFRGPAGHDGAEIVSNRLAAKLPAGCKEGVPGGGRLAAKNRRFPVGKQNHEIKIQVYFDKRPGSQRFKDALASVLYRFGAGNGRKASANGPRSGPKLPGPSARAIGTPILIRAHYRCLRNKRPSKPCNFMGFGAMYATKAYKFIWFGDIHGPKPYQSIGCQWAFISQAPVALRPKPAKNHPGSPPREPEARLLRLLTVPGQGCRHHRRAVQS
jgi:hypothetical protein